MMKIRELFPLRRYPIPALILLVSLIALALTSLRVRQQKGIVFVDTLLMEVSAPLQRVSSGVIHAIRQAFRQYVFLIEVQKENQILKQRIADLQKKNDANEEALLANERLRRLLQFRDSLAALPGSPISRVPVIASEVIGQDPSSWFRSVTINKGEGDGVRKGMAVISSDGVVGQVLKASFHYATVLLITDYNSAVDAIAQKTRARAIVEGKGENRCQMKYLLRTDEVHVGDIIVTSGLGNFPKGLPIGEIRKVEKKGHSVFQYAELVPSVDLTQLEEVLVIAGSSTPAAEEKSKKSKKSMRKFLGGAKKK